MKRESRAAHSALSGIIAIALAALLCAGLCTVVALIAFRALIAIIGLVVGHWAF